MLLTLHRQFGGLNGECYCLGKHIGGKESMTGKFRMFFLKGVSRKYPSCLGCYFPSETPVEQPCRINYPENTIDHWKTAYLAH